MAQAKVAVFGCGALGNEVLKNLALLGVGNIWVVDYDTIEKHNLTRSVLFRESDIGRYKAEVVAERVKELNPDTQVYPILGKLEFAFGRGLLREMDVAFGCLDSVGARREINQRCYFAGVPWIDGGINHELGNVALFDPRVPETACYRCQMDKSAWERLNERFSCGYLNDRYEEPKLATTIMTSSVIAAYQVEVAVQLLLFGESHLKPGSNGNTPRYRTEHILVINNFPSDYGEPGKLPDIKTEMPLFHPNVYSQGEFCFKGNELQLSIQPLDFLVARVISMIQYENLRFGVPANSSAGDWAAQNQHLFPLRCNLDGGNQSRPKLNWR